MFTERVADQAALHGLLARVRGLGLPLIEERWLATAAIPPGKEPPQ